MGKTLREQTPKIIERDLKILEEIWQYGFRTFAELRPRYLQNYSESWAYRILKRLAILGYIDEYYTPDGRLMGWKTGHAKLIPGNLRDNKKQFSISKSPKYFASFEHDLAIRNVLDEFKNLSITSKVTTEQDLRREALDKMKWYSKRDLNEITSKIPDGRIYLKLGKNDFQVALEVELNRKTNSRIQAKLEHYIVKSSYDFVLYVVDKKSVLNALWRNYEEVLSTSPAVKFASKRNPIYFCYLKECKEDLTEANIFSIDDQFKCKRSINPIC